MQPIAITGIGCRFPGGADDPDAFWQMLCAGTDAVTEVPPNRWPTNIYFDQEKGRTGKSYSKWGAFLSQIDEFDAGFFGITDSEADAMDPQQRLVLETAWEAMEDAGYVPNPSGERTGVFVGVSTRDYELLQGSPAELNEISPFSATGLASSIVANRLSYCFNFTGPSFIVDTACSSSLLAVHLACRSLWAGECDTAIAAGVNCLIGPNNFLAFSSMGLLSPDGRCRSFDHRANGFVRGEGAGAILLRPLADAVADGAPVYAVIRATGTNQDGRTSGLAYPSRQSQIELLRKARDEVGLSPQDLVYMEAHGTGTAAGDPVEAGALGEVFGIGREAGRELLIGSVKSNIGHLEAGAGIAGIIKCALCLKHGLAPPNLHFEKPNSNIDFGRLRLKVPTAATPFPRHGDSPESSWFAGVNSFGFGGSNAFALLQGYAQPQPETSPANVPTDADDMLLLPVSAKSADSLKKAALQLAERLEASASNGHDPAKSVVAALSLRRSHHAHRLTVTGRSSAELASQLSAFARDEATAHVKVGEVRSQSVPVFVFSGQGAQWHAMGRRLYEREPVFRGMLERCDEALASLGGWSLLTEFLADEAQSRMMETAIAQPSIFAIQVALAEQWAHWGVRPAAVIGHSVGEVAAAYVAGIYDLPSAMRVIYQRGATMSRASTEGRMLAAALSESQAQEVLAACGGRAEVAAVNSPTSVTLAGTQAALDEVAGRLESRGIWHRFVPVNYAFHSAQMDPVREPLLAALAGLTPAAATLPIYSTVFGRRIEGPEMSAEYWWRNVREAVRFGPAVEAAVSDGYTTFVEVAAHPVLSTSLKQCLQQALPDQEFTVLPSLRQRECDHAVMLGSLGALHCQGQSIAWRNVAPPHDGRPVALPHYAWQRKRHWNESAEWARTRDSKLRHPFLMRRIDVTQPTWRCLINTRLFPYLKDHGIQGRPLFPATGYAAMALAAAAEAYPGQPCDLIDVELERALFLPEAGRNVHLQLRLDPTDRRFAIYSSQPGGAPDAAEWTRGVRGTIMPMRAFGSVEYDDLAAIRSRCTAALDAPAFYEKTLQSSFNYGPLFQAVRQAHRRDGEVLARIELPEPLHREADGYPLHPTLLDACMQLSFVVMNESDVNAPIGMFIPYGFDRLTLAAPLPKAFWGHARLLKQGRSTLCVEIRALDDEGRVIATMRNLRFRPMEGADDANFLNWFYLHEWIEKPLPGATSQTPATECLPQADALTKTLQARAAELCERFQTARLADAAGPDVDRLWAAYVVGALGELGWHPEVGDEFSTAKLSNELSVPPERAALLEHVLQFLASRRVLERRDDRSWRVAAPADVGGAAALWSSLLERFPSLFHELTLLRHSGEILGRVLVGEYDDRRSVARDETSRLLEQARVCGPWWLSANLLLRTAVEQVVASLPRGRRLQLLELGAGSGGLASHLAAVVSPQSTDYLLTDRPGAGLANAEDQQRRVGFGECSTLDLAIDPAEQNIACGRYDLVVGQDPFPPGVDPSIQLQNAAKLLAPGGYLIFTEADAASRIDDLRRLLDANDAASTEDAAPMRDVTRESRRQRLSDAGFTDVAVIAETPNSAETGRAAYLARRPTDDGAASASESKSTTTADRGAWLVLADRNDLGATLVEAMRADGYDARLATAEDVLETPDQWLATDYRGIVYLGGVDAGTDADPSLAALQQAQTIGSHTALRLVRRLINRPAGGAAPQLWFVTRGAQPVGGDDHPLVAAQTPLIGFGRVLLNEHPEFRCRLVDLGPADDAAVAARALVHEFDAADREDQVAWRGGVRYVHRLTRMSNLDSPRPAERGLASDVPCRLQIGRHGMLDQLRLRPIERRAPEPHEVEVAVCAAGVNFRDVMKALGIYPGDAPDADSLGDEFAGVVTRVGSAVTARRVGERVFGVCLGAMATHVTVDAGVCMPLPDDMSFEEGATIPVVYLTAYRALNQLARMQPGERVLVHSAAGGVGHAATRLALQAGLEVFGTAGSPAKRQMLRNIGVHHVFNSRTLDFADEIMAVTKGEGIDIVLNSLAGDAIPRSLELLRLNGRFLEIGKRDIYGGTAVSLKPFRNSLAYFAIDMARELVPPHAGPLLEEIRTLLGRDVVRPLPFQSFPFGEVAAAFRYMAQGKHNGKIVLTIDQTALARRSAYNASRGAFRGDATYLITGGLRGFGLAFAEHLVARGARHLVLTSQSGPTSEESQTGIERLRSQGVNVLACKSDAASESDVSALLAEIDRTMPPLAGVIHAATTYADALIRDLDTTSFERPMIPKAYGAWNLHRATLGRRLDLFVTISSISAVVGNTGQANYVAANAFLDALAETRRRQYLPGLSLQLDRIRDVGHVARDQALTDRFARLNWWGISAAQALEGFDRLLANDPPVGLVTSFNWMKTSSGLGPLLASPRFEQVVREESAAGDDEGSAAIRRRLDAASPDQKSDIIRTFLLREIADVLRTSPRKLSVEAPLKDIGMDSLMAVELMARVESKLGMTLPAQQLSAESTVMTITAAALTLLGVAPTRAAAPAAKE